MRLIILGSASGYPTAQRTSSGYILDIDGNLVLLDCGSGVTRAFMRAHLDPHLLHNIIISHTHPDHVGDLAQFIQMLKLSRKSGILNIYLPKEALDSIENYLNACYLFREKLPFELTLKPVIDSWKIDGSDIAIRCIANKHLTGNVKIIEEFDYPNKMQSYSYFISSADKRIFYSGDIGSLDDIKKHIHDLDFVLIETSHIDTTELLEIAATMKIKKIVLTHISDEKENDLQRVVQNNRFGLDVVLARDGDIIIL